MPVKKKSKHAELIATIQEIATIGKERGLLHQYTEDYSHDGRLITVNGNQLINFGSCSYLGLETDRRIKDGGIDAIERYGSQLACSRAYLSTTLYKEFEEAMFKMFNAPVLIATTTSVGHQAVMPTVIDDKDAIILDQQAHWSMQDVATKMQLRGITVTKVRHSRLDELEEKIKELSQTHEKIWYVIDGIYSMYGDPAPLHELVAMLDRIKQLYLYVDDAHGISWAGKNGSGYTLSQIELHPKMILATSLGKAFANAGGIFLFPDKDLCWKVRSWGGPLSQSGPQPPSVIGSCIATAKIHLSDEIYARQNELAEKIKFCNELLKKKNLPLVFESPAPIFFIGLGLPRVGYNLVNRLLNEGLYVNLAVFPVVPESCTGIRFAITLHLSNEDIERLVDRMAYHLPLALQEEGRTMDDIYRAFKSLKHLKKAEEPVKNISFTQKYQIQTEQSITNIDKDTWNNLFENNGVFDTEALKLLEDVFSGNEKEEDNWKFKYYIVRNAEGQILNATFFTTTLSKNDMLSSSSVSKKIEELRKQNPYYQTSKTMMMGSPITEGIHLYINRENPEWKEALVYLIDNVSKEKEGNNIDLLIFRDFDANDHELRNFFIDQGFIKIEMLDTHILDISKQNSRDEFLTNLSSKKRRSIREEVLDFEKYYTTTTQDRLNNSEIEMAYKLYENVFTKAYELNVFKLPFKLFQKIANAPNWGFIILKLKKEIINTNEDRIVAIGCVYRNRLNYYPSILGIDYEFIEYNIYKQLLYQTILEGIQLNKQTIFLGLTVSTEKRKFGANAQKRIGFVQLKDDFEISTLGMIPE